jgi:hypothetical protein
MHEMLRFSFRNILTNISIFYGEYHVWHPPNYDIWQAFDLFIWDFLKKILLCFEVLEPKQTKCALQKSEPPSCDIQAFINS